jgi:hypothetical protein
VYGKDIVQAFNWLKYLGEGVLHLKPTAGCQIKALIFEKKIEEGDLYEYPMNNMLRTENFLSTWGLSQRYCPGL